MRLAEVPDEELRRLLAEIAGRIAAREGNEATIKMLENIARALRKQTLAS